MASEITTALETSCRTPVSIGSRFACFGADLAFALAFDPDDFFFDDMDASR
jgi:hypothetical protein